MFAKYVAGTFLLLAASTSNACIESPDPKVQKRALDADLALQAQMVKSLAAEADTVLIAFAEKEQDAHHVLFKIEKMIRGTMPPSGHISYMWRPGTVAYCRASERFFDINPWQGNTYILYARNGALLRAGFVKRDGADISLDEEVKIVIDNPPHLTTRSSGP